MVVNNGEAAAVETSRQPIPPRQENVRFQTHEMSIGPDGKIYQGGPTPYGEVITLYEELVQEARKEPGFDPDTEDSGLWAGAVDQAIARSRTGESHAGVLVMAGIGMGQVRANEWRPEDFVEEFAMRDSRMGLVLELGDVEFGGETMTPDRIEAYLNSTERNGLALDLDRRLHNVDGMDLESRLWNVRSAMKAAADQNPMVRGNQRETAQAMYSLAKMEQDLVAEIKRDKEATAVGQLSDSVAATDAERIAAVEKEIRDLAEREQIDKSIAVLLRDERDSGSGHSDIDRTIRGLDYAASGLEVEGGAAEILRRMLESARKYMAEDDEKSELPPGMVRMKVIHEVLQEHPQLEAAVAAVVWRSTGTRVNASGMLYKFLDRLWKEVDDKEG